jgi:siroheme synthase-like protein
MSYFPLLLELSGAPCLVAGGGPLGLRKAKTLLENGAAVTVVAPDPCRELTGLPVTLLRKPVEAEDVRGMLLVVDATGDERARRLLSAACREEHILFNSACSTEDGNAIFPAVFRRGRTLLAVSSLGASPIVSTRLRDALAAHVPEGMDAILEAMTALRPRSRAEFPEQQRRSEFLHRCLETMLALSRPLTEGETDGIIQRMKENNK